MIQIMSVQMIEGGVGWGYSRKYQSSQVSGHCCGEDDDDEDASFHLCVEILMVTTDDWVHWSSP